MTVRVLVAGGGLAGALLAWRLAQRPGTTIELVTGPVQATAADATAISGGAVRAYDTLPEQRALALASLVELLASPVLREWARYRETGFAYLLAPGPSAEEGGSAGDGDGAGDGDCAGDGGGAGDGLAAALAEIERALPGSAELSTPARAFRGADGGPGWAGEPGQRVIRERQAGQTSPAGLRDAVLADLAARPRVVLRDGPLDRVDAATTSRYDAVVLAAGAWTPALLRASGLPADGYRTRAIRYTIYDAGPVRPPAFADERTGLYGLPTADGGLLLGVPTTDWDVPPGRAPGAATGAGRAAELATQCFPRLKLGAARRRDGAADCYTDPPVLALRRVSGGAPHLFTFTGGSGGCAKSALAASQRAAAQLTGAASP